MLFGRARRAEKAGKHRGFNPEVDVTIIRSICEIGSSEQTQIMAAAGTYGYQACQRGIT